MLLLHALGRVVLIGGKIWNLDVANEVEMFVWFMARNSLQVKMNIARGRVKIDTRRPVCWRFDKDPGHFFG